MFDLTTLNTEWYGLKSLEPVIIKAKTISELRSKSRIKGLTILLHPDKKIFRYAVEKSLVDAVLPNRITGNDKIHHPRTLLNNVVLKLMSKNKVSLLFTTSELLRVNGVKRAIVWGRMKYEMKLCLKKSVPVIIATLADRESELMHKHSLLAFGQLLGLSPLQAKNGLMLVHKKVLERDYD